MIEIKKIIRIIIILLFMIPCVNANIDMFFPDGVNDAIAITNNNAAFGSSEVPCGYRIVTTQDSYIISVSKLSSDTSTKVYITTAIPTSGGALGGTTLGSATFSGSTAAFTNPIKITAGTTYYVNSYSDGASRTIRYDSTMAYPVTNADISITASFYGNSLSTSAGYSISNIVTQSELEYSITAPDIVFVNGSTYALTNISFNSSIDGNFNQTYYLYNSSDDLFSSDMFVEEAENGSFYIDSLVSDTYFLSFKIQNSTISKTSNNYTFTIDVTPPSISFNNNTEFNYGTTINISDVLNVTCSDVNIANCTIYWSDNTTSFSSTGVFSTDKTFPSEIDNYSFIISAFDLAGNSENSSGNIYINPFRLNITFYSAFSGDPLYNISLEETDLGSLGNSGNDNYLVVFVNPGSYNFTASKTGYRDSVSILTKNNISIQENFSINISATFNFTLKDERTLELFNLTPVTRATMQVICLDESVIQHNINSTNFEVELPCAIRNIKFILDYTSDSYFRSILVDESEINRDVYLIDLTTTQSIFNTFTIFDLTQIYENPRLSFKKYVGTNQVEITGDVIDVEGKVPGYFILNDQYIMELSSDNLPTRSLGFYSADTLGDRVIKLFSLDFKISETNKVGKVNMISYIFNSTVYGIYNDTTLSTSLAEITIYNSTIYGNVLYTDQIVGDDVGSFSYNLPGSLENTTLFVVLEVTNSLGTFKDQRTLRQNNELTLGLINFNLSKDWIITVFLGFIGLLFTASTATTGGLILMGLSALFVTFGWFTLSWHVISVSIILAILKLVKEGDKK